MMANNYESLKTDGHYTMARRIFQKIKGWIQGKNYVTGSYSSIMAPMVGIPNLFTLGVEHDNGTDIDLMTFQEGENIAFTYIYSSGNITGVTFSSDQIEDSYNYQQYQNLPRSTKMKDKLFIVDDAPDLDPAILNLVYPVGTYYETSDTTFNPNVTWGGTWVLEIGGLVHVSAGTNYAVTTNAQDGGEATHTLTIGEMPSHYHGITMGGYINNVSPGSGFTVPNINNQGGRSNPTTSPAGGGQAHNNMQPYKIVNRWHRTA